MTLRKYIPDFLTAMNLVCGLIALVYAFGGRSDIAFYLMLAAAVFDFSDGFAARALHAYSDMGKELDSLCDLVSFGHRSAYARLRDDMRGTLSLCAHESFGCAGVLDVGIRVHTRAVGMSVCAACLRHPDVRDEVPCG